MPLFHLRVASALVAFILTMVAHAESAETSQPEWPNPLIRQRADPFVFRHTDGFYYFMGTVPEFDRLELRRAASLEALPTAEAKTIWRQHASGAMGSHIWAPEIHFIDGRWFIYFAAGGAEKENRWAIRIYVLENASPNPLEGEWIERGQLKTGWESFALDATTFSQHGTRYLLWAQKDPALDSNTNLYLAKMDTPTSIVPPAVRLSQPEFAWEKVRYAVNEGPAILHRHGRFFLTYSAAGTGAEYCLGLLSADENADLLDPKSWTKSPQPVFTSSEQNGIYGPGHNCFTTTPDGKTDLLVYHARNYRDIPGDPLHDPNRHTRVQPVAWRLDGTPDFGRPAPESRPERAPLAAGDRWDAPHAANPILPGYYADPSLVEFEGRFFLYATLDPWGGQTLGCWESPDFKQWTFRELNWPTKAACTSPTSASAMVWAPSVVRARNGRFYLYVSVGSEVWVGTAEHPLGPWHDANGGRPLIPATWNRTYHMIDAEAFLDDDGAAYLYWGSGWGWKNGHCFAVKLKADMTTFDGEVHDVTPENYFEGPFMFKDNGRYYLMYSQGVTIRDTYAVHYAIGHSPFGPFTEAATSPILTTDHARNVVSPGHHAVFRHGGRAYILYHRQRVPYVPEQAYRQLCVDELTFTVDGLISKVTPTHTGPALAQGRSPQRLAATAIASSELGPLYAANHVLDDNYATRWAAVADAEGAWLRLDLGHVKSVGRQELRFEYAWKSYRFILEASGDGETWTTVADHRAGGIAGSPVAIDAPVDARYLRLVFPDDEPADMLSLFEWSVWEAAGKTR